MRRTRQTKNRRFILILFVGLCAGFLPSPRLSTVTEDSSGGGLWSPLSDRPNSLRSQHLVDASASLAEAATSESPSRTLHAGEFECAPGYSVVDTISALHLATRALDAADLDMDGDIDIVSGSATETDELSLSWWENDGTGVFVRNLVDSTFVANTAVASDVDSDGDLDLICAKYNASGLFWYENDGEEQYTRRIVNSEVLASGAYASNIDAADLDGDNDVDIVVPGVLPNRFPWFENDGNENFHEHSLPSSHGRAWMIVAADIDSDGDADLIAAADSSSEIPWWENNGSGEFTLHAVQGIAYGIRWVHPCDLDLDGDIDIVGVSQGPPLFAWWENDGSESFQMHPIPTPWYPATMVSCGDLDLDGDTDLLTCSLFRWWENDGDSIFTEHLLPGSFSGQGGSVLAVDLDEDRLLDVVGADWRGRSLVWWQNECVAPPCDCPNQGDLDTDGFLTALDLAIEIDILFAAGSDPQDIECPTTRGDWDCDHFTTALDLSEMIDHLFAGAEGPCDPCCPFIGVI